MKFLTKRFSKVFKKETEKKQRTESITSSLSKRSVDSSGRKHRDASSNTSFRKNSNASSNTSFSKHSTSNTSFRKHSNASSNTSFRKHSNASSIMGHSRGGSSRKISLVTPLDPFTNHLLLLKRSFKKEDKRLHLIEKMPNDEIENYRKAFCVYDRNGDGSIDQGELLYVMRMLGENPSEDQITNIMYEMDDDGNGKIEFEEFLMSMAERRQLRDSMEDLRMAFEVFDIDGNGQISTDELTHVMTNITGAMTEREAEDLMRIADTDNNGYIDYNEFVAAITAE